MTTTQTERITDRNEVKALFAWKFNGKPVPRDANTLDFAFESSDKLSEARQAYALNQPVPVQSFIAASKLVDRLIYDYRTTGGVR